MYFNTKILRYLNQLDTIERKNRRKFNACQPFVLYQLLIAYCRYWRELEAADFHGLDLDSISELYTHFNIRLRSVFSAHLDIYWLIQGYDGKLLLQDGREVNPFWRREYLPQPHL